MIGASNVVSLHHFRHARTVWVLFLGCKTMDFEEAPRARRVATIAACTAHRAAARKHVFRGKLVLYSTVAGNANAVAHCFDTAEGPTRATRRLIPDVTDVRALGPRAARVKGLRHFNGRVVVGFESLESTSWRTQTK